MLSSTSRGIAIGSAAGTRRNASNRPLAIFVGSLPGCASEPAAPPYTKIAYAVAGNGFRTAARDDSRRSTIKTRV